MTIDVVATDAGGGPACSIQRVLSTEPVTGPGDDTSPDWIVDGPLSLRLRAERRAPGTGRYYVILVACADPAGNATQTATLVVVSGY